MKKIFFFILVILSIDINAQNDATAFDNLVSNDTSIMASLFSYPDTVYNSILVASTHPKGFQKLNEIQKISSDSFKKLISTYNRNTQKQLWEITRYPEIISILIENKDKSKKELEEKLQKYPAKIKSSAIYLGKNNYSTIVQIDQIHKDFETKYKDLLKDLPNDVKAAYNSILGNPELVTALSENIKTTSVLGELYSRNPALIKQKADSLNFEIAKAKGIEYENWKSGIQKDTVVQKELQDMSKKYSTDDSYDDDVYASSNEPREVNKVYEVAPYPYWAGYPYWYGNNYWYPYPWWFQMGFYWPLNGPMHFYGLPSYHFGWWYYNQPNRYYRRYPNATNYFYRHNQGRRNFNSDFNRSTQEFYRGRRK
ncbi:MAG: hypothetical protein Q8L90_00410 [Bacteroidota bacterium]|nr:hypothetical protein [Bacteroidota bacterium]